MSTALNSERRRDATGVVDLALPERAGRAVDVAVGRRVRAVIDRAVHPDHLLRVRDIDEQRLREHVHGRVRRVVEHRLDARHHRVIRLDRRFHPVVRERRDQALQVELGRLNALNVRRLAEPAIKPDPLRNGQRLTLHRHRDGGDAAARGLRVLHQPGNRGAAVPDLNVECWDECATRNTLIFCELRTQRLNPT